MDVKDSYQVLELEIGASRAAIEAAYFRMIERWHPDRVPPASGPAGLQEAQRMVDRINEAFRTLDKIAPKHDQPAAPPATPAPSAPVRPRIAPPLPEPVVPTAKPKPPAFTPPPAPTPASPPPPANAPAPVPAPTAASDAQPAPKSTTTPSEEPDDPDFLRTAWVRVEKMLPEDPKKRRAVLVGAAVILLLLVVLVGKCASTPARKARTGPDPATIGGLVVKSNHADATVEAALIPPAAEAATGSVGQPLAGLAVGKYLVTAHSAGWPDATGEATVKAGGTTEITLDFASGSLLLDSLPTGATVRWGQTVLGRTPLVVPQLPPGECTLILEYPNWTPLKTKVVIAENRETKETVRLPHGRLVVTSAPTGATVLLGKRSLGQTPLTLDRFQAGTRTLTLQLKDFPLLEMPVTVEDQGEQNIRGVMANGFPLLDAPATLQAVWFELPAGDPNRLSPHFDPFPGFHPQGTFVRNLNRKKLFEVWLGRTYRFTGTVKSYNPATGQLEFVEQVSSLGKIRVIAQLLPAARDDRETVALLSTKDTTVTICGRFSTIEESERRGRPFEMNFTQADVVR